MGPSSPGSCRSAQDGAVGSWCVTCVSSNARDSCVHVGLMLLPGHRPLLVVRAEAPARDVRGRPGAVIEHRAGSPEDQK